MVLPRSVLLRIQGLVLGEACAVAGELSLGAWVSYLLKGSSAM